MYICISVYMNIYIYRERERDTYVIYIYVERYAYIVEHVATVARRHGLLAALGAADRKHKH